MNSNSLFLFLFLVTTLSLVIISINQTAFSQLVTYRGTGNTTLFNETVSQVLENPGSSELSVILRAIDGNFSGNDAEVSISNDNEGYLSIENVSLGSVTQFTFSYDSTNRTQGVNPALFPYLKVELPQIVNATQQIIWSFGR